MRNTYSVLDLSQSHAMDFGAFSHTMDLGSHRRPGRSTSTDRGALGLRFECRCVAAQQSGGAEGLHALLAGRMRHHRGSACM